MLDGACQFFNGLLYSLDLVSVKALVSDTFTLIAGFIAIGIPLSLQVIQSASEKYKSPYLIKHLSSYYFISPAFLIVNTLIYLLVSIAFKYLLPEQPNKEFSYVLLGWAACFIFLELLLCTSIWYLWIFKAIRKSAGDLFDDLSE